MLSGALFYMALVLTHPSKLEMVGKIQGLGGATILVGLVLLTGSLVYTLHRALPFPLLLFPLALLSLMAFKIFPRGSPFRTASDLDIWRLEGRGKDDLLHRVTAEWGAQVHFLYCSSFTVLPGLCFSEYVELWPPEKPVVSPRFLLAVSLALFLGAFVHHLRLLLHISAFRKSEMISAH